jgi:hypothetical protein
MSELAPCQFWIRLDSKVLRNLMVNQRSMLGMSMRLLVKGAIGTVFVVGWRRAVRNKVLLVRHLVRNKETLLIELFRVLKKSRRLEA